MNPEGLRGTLLVTGASRSGKSDFARRWAEAHPPPRLFLATARALDEEMAERIRRHREERGSGWFTVEEPLEVEEVIGHPPGEVSVILLDCVTLWLNNLMMEGLGDEQILERGQNLCLVVARAKVPVGLVTNEVGWGIVPDNSMGRRFRDLAGTLNQMLARTVRNVVLMVAGFPLVVKHG